MKKHLKRLHLAESVLTVTLLLLQNAEAIIELISKVVNYARDLRKLPAFLLEERKTHIRSERVQLGIGQAAQA
ncbi:hypothetical protein LB533_15175 [Mesorhizobium sp. BR1-1-13]|uniref:hypothetical protein n=1 Tax=Mesorhizobium sp. BR1-1-13 TaxID=2876656 RepID=UPI001CD13A32|nr:hypothetical protein [Mesorhizobium sp. BR1-1-13]MBZ9942436.1 hypothetical protein [Mesorhizobium sp. BR1-1-13]